MRTLFATAIVFSAIIAGCGDKDDTGSDRTSGGECGSFNDTSSYYNDIQYDSFCWEAGNQRSCDAHDNADEICDTLQSFLDETGGGSASTCPYC